MTYYPCRDVGNYVLISRIGGTQTYPDLKRLPHGYTIPSGWERIDVLFGESVFSVDGRLIPEYWALEIARRGKTIV
jgi:hypothetical protein